MDDLRSTAAALIKCWETGNYGTISDCLADDFVEFDPPQRTSRGITDISENWTAPISGSSFPFIFSTNVVLPYGWIKV